MQKLNFLESLRGYAIIGVVFTHAAQKIPELQGWLYNLGIQGARGVQLFFIVSAFTLFYTLHRKYEIESEIKLGEFYLRRFFRIAPMFYTALVVYSIIDIVTFKLGLKQFLGDYSMSMILSTVSFTSILNPAWLFSLVPGGWSISVEFMFYLLVPILYRIIRNLKVSVVITLVISLLSWLLNFIVTHYQLIDSKYLEVKYLFYWFPNQIPVFLIGITCFYFWRDYKGKFNKHVLLIISLLSMLLLGLTGSIYNPIFPKHLLFGISFALFALSLSAAEKSILNHRFMIFVGKISFSVYLVHFLILDVVEELLLAKLIELFPVAISMLLLFTITIGISIVVAYLSFRIIEEPGIKLGRMITSRQKKQI